MEDVFITKIKINKVRHLNNIEIKLSDEARKHLILTGDNGSGKTSFLTALATYLSNVIENKSLLQISNSNKELKNISDNIKSLQVVLKGKISENEKLSYSTSIKSLKQSQKIYQDNINSLEGLISLNFNNTDNVVEMNQEGNYIIAFFNAKREINPITPQGVKLFGEKRKYNIKDTIGRYFIQHIVNLKADKSFARDDHDFKTVDKIERWFNDFEKILKIIFNDKKIKLQFDRNNYNFKILQSGKEEFNFNTLADGYSAIFNIITELILRMNVKKSKSYDIQGIVLIDEVETHLHIDLQKKILPFLTKFFPKIQFIISTHSPFILTSIDNAVVYDLQNHLYVADDLTGYSYESIIEGYFYSDKYSYIIKSKLKEYERLVKRKKLKQSEKDRMFELRDYLKRISEKFSPELILKYQQIELSRLEKK